MSAPHYPCMNSDEAQQTILVVEDEVFIRMSAVASLEDAGFAVHDAKDSAEALRVLAQHDDISLMMTDVRMPGVMDGLELVAAIQRDYPAIRAIVASGNSTAAQASGVDCIFKAYAVSGCVYLRLRGGCGAA